MKLRGYIKSYEDALLIAYGVHFGLIEPIKERLLTYETNFIKSGDIFVFVEKMNFMRWIDYRKWSPSRSFLGDFLIYREITHNNVKEYLSLRKTTITISINGVKYHIINYFINILYSLSISEQLFFKDLKRRLKNKDYSGMKPYNKQNSIYSHKRISQNELIEIFLNFINTLNK